MNTPQPAVNDAQAYPRELWLRTLLRWYIGLIIRPTPTIREIVDRRPQLAGLGMVGAGFLVSILIGYRSYDLMRGESVLPIDSFSLEALGDYLLPETLTDLAAGIFTVVFVFALMISLFTLWAGILHWITGKFGGRGSLGVTVSAMMMISTVGYFAYCAGILIVGIIGRSSEVQDPLDLVTYTSFALIGVGVLWMAVLAGILLRWHYDINSSDASITVTASLISTFILGVVVFFAWGALFLAVTFIFFPDMLGWD